MRRQLGCRLFSTLGIAVALSVPALRGQSPPAAGEATDPPPQARTVITRALAFNNPQRVSSTAAGQAFNLTFSGMAAQAVSLAVVSGALPCAVITSSIVRPNGDTFASRTACGSASWNNLALPATGAYAVFVNPGTAKGGITLTLTRAVKRAVTLGSPETVSSTLAGQVFNLTFDGETGDRVTIAESDRKYPKGAMSFAILKPDGKVLASAHHVSGNTSLNNETLPATGTYTIYVNPGWASGGATFTVNAGSR